MPITNVGGVVTETLPIDNDQFLRTGVHRADQFALCHVSDRFRQFQFDLSAANVGSTIKLAAGPSGSVVVTLPSSSGTLALTSGLSNSFVIMQPDVGTSPTASSNADTLTLTSTNSTITITGTASSKTLAFVVNPNLSVTTATTSSQFKGADASNSAPSFSFTNSTNTGMYSPASGKLGLVSNGTESVRVHSTGLSVGASASTAPVGAMILDGGGMDDLRSPLVLKNGSTANALWDILINPNTGNLIFYNPNQGVTGITFLPGGGVSFGAQAPLFCLDVNGADAGSDPLTNTKQSPIAQLRNFNATANNTESLMFCNSGQVPVVLLTAVNEDHSNTTQTGHLRVYTANGGAATEKLRVTAAGNIRFSSGNYTTGSGTALLGTNCPASTVSAPNTWLKFEKSDGTLAYVPAWV